jgi:hypothetical protein
MERLAVAAVSARWIEQADKTEATTMIDSAATFIGYLPDATTTPVSY